MSDYKSYMSQIESVKSDVKKQAFSKKKEVKQLISEDQVRWAEGTIELTKLPAFKNYMELEATITANSLRHAFLQRNNTDSKGNPIPNTKTYGEQMSYNEGFYHGLLALKSERERIWVAYLNSIKKKEGE